MIGLPATVVSLFSGIGGLDLGFERAGCRILWASDNSKAAVDSYYRNFGRNALLADINDLDLASIPDSDIVIGGPPCQSFSLLGQRRADDERGRLVYRYLEVIKVKSPRAFVMENVPGIAASKIGSHRLTDVLVSEMTELGYQVSTFKLDASDYLVPQRRRRIFLVGLRGGFVPPPNRSTFATDCYDIDINTYDRSSAAAIGDLGDPVKKGQVAKYNRCSPSKFAGLMRGKTQTFTLHEQPTMSATDKLLLSFIPPGGNYRDVPDEHSTQRILNFKRTGGRTTTYARLHPERPAYTINTYFRRPNVGANFHYSEPRLITAREAMRFQSIPDDFTTIHSSQEDRNALIGNAVPPLLAHAVAWALIKALQGEVDLAPRSQGDLL